MSLKPEHLLRYHDYSLYLILNIAICSKFKTLNFFPLDHSYQWSQRLLLPGHEFIDFK